VCTLITDGTHNPPRFVDSGIPFILVSNITGNVVTYDTPKYITEETYEIMMKRTPIEKGDVLLSTVGSYGHPAVVVEDKKFAFQRHVAHLKPNKDIIDSRFLHTAILSSDVQEQIEVLVLGVAQKTLNLSAIKKIRIPVPSLDQQKHFIAFVEQSDKSKLNDKPMKDHTLLQAICRTNRVYGEGKTNGLIVDYIGIFDDVAKALDFDEKSVQKVITNIEEVKKVFPSLIQKCLAYFPGVDRTVEGWEGLMAAQECLPTNKEKDAFGADYRVVNRAYNALSPDPFLDYFRFDYRWLSKVYESIKPVDNRGQLIWASVGAKTLELVHENIDVETVKEAPEEEILELDAELIEDFIEGKEAARKKAKKVEIDLVARILEHRTDPRFIRLGERLEELREKHEQGLLSSIEFLKRLLELAKDAAEAEKEVVPAAEVDKGKAALTELFNSVRNANTPVIVERIVKDIDDIVRIVRFDGWQDTVAGRKEVKKALRSVVSVKYKIKDKEVFNKAYGYVEQYY